MAELDVRDVYVAMNDLAARSGAANLGQAVPAGPPPAASLSAVARAMAGGGNQYAPSIGVPRLREAIVTDAAGFGAPYDADREVTVTAGCTEALAAALLSSVRPGDEVLVLEPFYDAYPPIVAMARATLVPVPLVRNGAGYGLDLDRISSAVTARTRALLITTPHNPTGLVLSATELAAIGAIADRHDLLVVSDEVYGHLTYDVPFSSAGAVPGLRERTIVCSSASKSLNLSGWRVGWALAPAALTAQLRDIHRFLSFCAPAPLQPAVADGMAWAARNGYYEEMRSFYRTRRDTLATALRAAAFTPLLPDGGIVMVTGTENVDSVRRAPVADPFDLAERLAEDPGVVGLPLITFYHAVEPPRTHIRFSFSVHTDVLDAAVKRLTAARRPAPAATTVR